MSLRPPEFVVEPDDPFKNDTLGRERAIKTLAEIIAGEQQAAVISVNGGFGSGKSAFLKMLAAHMRKDHETDLVEFDAWQQSYTKDPLVDVVSALAADRDDVASRLMPIAAKLAGRVAWRVTAQLVKTATVGIADLESVDFSGDDEEAGFEFWNDAHKRVGQFQSILGDIVEKAKRNLVVIVDELDRCRPDYAIDMLNVVRHLFDVPGVVIVLGVNRDELEHRVQEVFGIECKADIYLRRFVDLPINLRPPDSVRLGAFVGSVVRATQTGGQASNEWVNAALELLLTSSDTGLRDVQQLARLIVRVVPPGGNAPRAAYYRLAALGLILLRHVDRSSYERFTSGATDAIAAVSDLRARFPGIAVSEESEARQTLDYLESMLFHVGDEHGHSAATSDDFVDRFEEAELGDVDDAARILEIGEDLRLQMSPRHLPLWGIANRIDLLA